MYTLSYQFFNIFCILNTFFIIIFIIINNSSSKSDNTF